MKWYSLLFSITLGFVIPNSSNHSTRQRIFIMYSYICIMFYFCVHQNFVCHTKRVVSVPSHHQPAEWSSVVSTLLIIPRKSIMLPPSISLPAPADSPSHISTHTVNQPREEALCLCRWSVDPCPLEVALCCCCQSYQEKSIVLPPSINLPAPAESPSHVTSQNVDQPSKEVSCLCHWSVHLRPLEVASCRRHWSYQEQSIVSLPSISSLLPADLLLHVTSQTVNQPREEASCLCRWSVHPHPLVLSRTH